MFERFYKRISIPQKDIQTLMSKVAADYHIGKCLTHKIIPVGYEVFNTILETDRGKYFIKALVYYKESTSRFSHAKSYNVERRLMEKVYSKGPELYGLGADFIYGGRMGTFSRRINEIYDDNFFNQLMKVADMQLANELLRQIR